MNAKAIITNIILLAAVSCTSADKMNSSIDKNIIVPGETAEGFNLGEHIEKDSFKVYESRRNNIADILELDNFSDLKFDSMVIARNVSVLFINKGVITAIAGLNADRRVTSGAVLLSRGIDNFILNYGNSGLLIIRTGNHSVYIYKSLGIAVFDDNNDNTINMYLIFPIVLPSSSPSVN